MQADRITKQQDSIVDTFNAHQKGYSYSPESLYEKVKKEFKDYSEFRLRLQELVNNHIVSPAGQKQYRLF